MSPANLTREQLEADANLLRERIAQNLESLDQRRHDAFDAFDVKETVNETVKETMSRHPLPLTLLGLGSALALFGSIGTVVYRARHRPSRFQVGIAAMKRVFEHPERVAVSHSEPMSAEIARGVVISIATFVATQLAKRALHQLVPELWNEPGTAANK